MFNINDVLDAINNSNFNKGIGPDGFDGRCLQKNQQLKDKAALDLTTSLNSGNLPPYLNIGRQVALSKNKTSEEATIDDIRPIVIKSHLTKVLEKAILAKIKEIDSKILPTAAYQAGFKEGQSTLGNLAAVDAKI